MKQTSYLKPIYNKQSKILILGSFPSELSRINNFYYANPNNRFWQILEKLFNTDLKNTNDKIKFLLNNKIALSDVILSCEIYKSNDSSIKNIIPNNLNTIIENSNIQHIFLNGKTAYNLFIKYHKNIKIPFSYLPSSSSANAKYSLDDLINEYQIIKTYL